MQFKNFRCNVPRGCAVATTCHCQFTALCQDVLKNGAGLDLFPFAIYIAEFQDNSKTLIPTYHACTGGVGLTKEENEALMENCRGPSDCLTLSISL